MCIRFRKKHPYEKAMQACHSEFYFYDCRVPFGFFPHGIWMDF